MKLNKLLERQIRKFFPVEYTDDDAFQNFIRAVNDSYNAYERDNELSARAFKISEEEYREVNSRLKEEIDQRVESVETLREAIYEMDNHALAKHHNDSLPDIIEFLKSQIIKRKEVETQLNNQKQFYEHILNNIPADIAVFSKDHHYLFVNPVAIKDTELRKWLIGKTDKDYCAYRNKPQSIAKKRHKLFAETVAAGVQKEWEEQFIGVNGNVTYNLRKMFPVFNEQGELDIVIGYGMDITERKLIEEQIKLSEKRYREIFDHSQALICTHDLNGIVLAVNNATVATFEYAAEELTGKPVSYLLPESARPDFDSTYLDVIKKDGKAEGVMVANSKTGKKIYLLYQNYLVHDEGSEPYVIGFSQDITARINAERALKKSEEKYRNIIANMNLGLLEVDNSEKILYANNSFCEMSGYEQDELIGKKANKLFIKGENKNIVDLQMQKRKQGISDAYELAIKNKRGEIRWWLISGAPVVNDNGEFKGSIGIHLDISEQKLLEMELRAAKSEAEHSAAAKETFLANMSHEIRTPMNAIMGLGRLLQKTSLEKHQRFYIDSIQTAADNLLVIINDILDFSKIEAGKIQLEHIGFNLGALIDNILFVLKHKAEEKGLALTHDIDTTIAEVLIGDPYRLNQVLMNLLSNSLKFTEKGKISINCSSVESLPGTQKMCIEVADTGAGMSKDFVANLFDKFTQEDATVTRKYGGTGLGMSISKQLVELMGGSIEVESEKDKGTRIKIILSLTKGSLKDLPQKDALRLDTQTLRGKKILLVEDNEMNRLVAYTLLNQYGAGIAEAENGLIAIEKIKTGSFDLVLMDMQMPEMDGIEATQYIRQHIDTTIPIIALTANALKGEEEKCLKAGMNDFLSKPFEEEQMVQLVAKWLGRDNVSATSVKKNDVTAQPLYSLKNLLAISRGNDGFIARMLELFVNEIPQTLVQIKSAADAADRKTVAALAHRIKPTIHNMCIETLKDDILILESALNQSPATLDQSLHRIEQILTEVVNQIIKKEIDKH